MLMADDVPLVTTSVRLAIHVAGEPGIEDRLGPTNPRLCELVVRDHPHAWSLRLAGGFEEKAIKGHALFQCRLRTGAAVLVTKRLHDGEPQLIREQVIQCEQVG